MLDSRNDRLDYGAELAPPDGFELDAAVATTYSLDLNALLAVPIALCFSNTLEGDLKGEKIALLEAMTQLKDKLKVFYQKGNIHCPSSYNHLYALLEPCLQAIVPSGGVFSSFHPKLWLLRFKESGTALKSPKIKYRLLILSRNLTFDRSWDLALSLDGERTDAVASAYSPSWITLFGDLLRQANDFEASGRLLKDLPHICWQVPKPFNKLELLVGGPVYGRPIDPPRKSLSALMVVSPFIKSQEGSIFGLKQLAGEHVDVHKVLCSRAEELNAIGAEALSDWDCYAINQSIVDGEETLGLSDGEEHIQSQNLHAKLIIRESGRVCDWFVGSANATSAALGDGDANPRNTEVMAKLSSNDQQLSPKIVLAQWLEQNLFVKHEFEPIELDDGEALSSALRKLMHELISANWTLHASKNVEEGYDLALSHTFDTGKLSLDAAIKISQLALPGQLFIANELKWFKATLAQLSAFIIVEVQMTRGEFSKTKRCVICADLTIEGGDARQQHLLQSLVDSPEKILNYVRLLLETQPSKAQWLAFESTGNEAQAAINALMSSDSPLFEQLMVAASRHPEVIERIGKLIERLKIAQVEIPSEFADLWSHFAKGRP